jgi:hypothetical protein
MIIAFRESTNVIADIIIESAELAVKDCSEDIFEAAINLAGASAVIKSAIFVDLINIGTENEHVLLANLFSDLNISTIHGTNDNATIHDKFHA